MMKNLPPATSRQGFVIFAAISLVLSLNLSAIDFTWEGENYRDVKVVKVEGSQVTLQSRKSGRIVVPSNRLSGLLAADAKKMAEAQKTASSGEKKGRRGFRSRNEVRDQDTWERAWIFGTVTSPTEDGFEVISSSNALPRGKERNGMPGKLQTTKGGSEVYMGRVFVRGLTAEENSPFDRVLWRDGYLDRGGSRVPVFSGSRPDIKEPQMSEAREWTNVDGRKMQATLTKVDEGGTAHFLNSEGKPFSYELSKLVATDQEFAQQAYEKHLEEVEQFKRDYPWVKVD